jgi:hypothetical protein
MRTLLWIVFLGALAASGCAHKQASAPPAAPAPPGMSSAPTTNPAQPKQPSQPIIVTPENVLAGKVVKINTAGRFVVLNFPIGRMPPLDQRLNVYRLGLKVGEVKVTGPQLDDNVVGDVVTGDAQTGDEVRDR